MKLAEQKCLYCNETYIPKRKGTKFCRKNCGTFYYRKSKVGRRLLLEKTGLICAICKFIAEHKSQLDCDHINGNHKDNSPDNLQIICSNCHRLKTFKNKDYLGK